MNRFVVSIKKCDECQSNAVCKHLEDRQNALVALSANLEKLFSDLPEWVENSNAEILFKCKDFIALRNTKKCIDCKHVKRLSANEMESKRGSVHCPYTCHERMYAFGGNSRASSKCFEAKN